MNKTLRDIVSELATDVKALSGDDEISLRFLAQKFNSKLEYFIRLEARSREFAKMQNIWKPINYVPLIDVPLAANGFTDACNNLKRSENTIPTAINTNYGLLIKVLTIDGRFEFKSIQSELSADYFKREFGVADKAFYIENNYVFVPNTDIEAIKILIVPKEPCSVDKLNGTIGKCSSPLDCVITYPDYLITLAKQEALKEISGIYKRVIEDEKTDDNTNIKN